VYVTVPKISAHLTNVFAEGYHIPGTKILSLAYAQVIHFSLKDSRKEKAKSYPQPQQVFSNFENISGFWLYIKK
jgi:hypothetical protein